MKHAKLGSLEVGRIGLGAMGMSGAHSGAGEDDAESIRTIHRALTSERTWSTRPRSTGPTPTRSWWVVPSPLLR
jgi:hypothetical protein